MTQKDLLHFERQLLAAKAKLLRQRDYAGAVFLHGDNETGDETSGNPADLADQGYETYQREMAVRLTSEQTRTLKEIDEALRRIEARTYGICEACGKPIPRERLELLPYARYDVDCLKKKASEFREEPVHRRRR